MNSTEDREQRPDYGRDKPPRLRREGESVADYRGSIGLDGPLQAGVDGGAGLLGAPDVEDAVDAEAPVAETRSGALEKHPQFTYALADYQAWFASLPESERGRPGQRNWRARCVAKACELLFAKTGRATGSAVLKIIGFGSSTDVSTDVREWLDNVAPRRLEWLQVSPLLQSPAVRESVESALKLIMASAQREAKLLAEADLDGQRAQLEAFKAQASQDVQRALEARDQALVTASAFERERDEHAAARLAAEEQRQRLEVRLDEAAATLAASQRRVEASECELAEAKQKASDDTKALQSERDSAKGDVRRLESNLQDLQRELEEARRQAREQREDLERRSAEVGQLITRIAEISHQLATQVAIATASEERTRQLDAEVRTRQAVEATLREELAAAQADLAGERGLREATSRRAAAIQQEALRRAAIAEVLQATNAVLVVDGDALPRMELHVDGAAITPRFDSLSQLEAYCEQRCSIGFQAAQTGS